MAKKSGPKTTWSSEDMKKALSHYEKSSDGFGLTGAEYGIPKTTLQLHWNRKNQPVKSGQVRSSSSESDRSSSPNKTERVRSSSPNKTEQVQSNPVKTHNPSVPLTGNSQKQIWGRAMWLLVGLFINELCMAQTGRTVFGWVADKFRGETVQLSSQKIPAGYLERPELKPEVKDGQNYGGYDLSEFK